MPNSLKELIQQMNGESVTVVQGVVTSANPLRIALVNDAMINLPQELLIVPEYLTTRVKEIEIIDIDGHKDSNGAYINGETEDGGTSPTGGPSKSNTGVPSEDKTSLALNPDMTDQDVNTLTGGSGSTENNAADASTGEDATWTGIYYPDPNNTSVWHRHKVAVHSHTIPGHTHSIRNHRHDLRAHTHSLNDHTHSIDPHKHDLKIRMKKIKIKIDDSLKVNEVVHMLSVGKGKIYYVLGRA